MQIIHWPMARLLCLKYLVSCLVFCLVQLDELDQLDKDFWKKLVCLCLRLVCQSTQVGDWAPAISMCCWVCWLGYQDHWPEQHIQTHKGQNHTRAVNNWLTLWDPEISQKGFYESQPMLVRHHVKPSKKTLVVKPVILHLLVLSGMRSVYLED